MAERKRKIDSQRQAILDEVEGWKTKHYEDLTWHVELNNFGAILPSADAQGGRLYARFVEAFKGMDTPFREIEGESGYAHLHSELFFGQTPREFYATVDKAINSSGVSRQEIDKLQHEYYQIMQIYNHQAANRGKESDAALNKGIELQQALYELALPVYVELRVMGYTQYDLTG